MSELFHNLGIDAKVLAAQIINFAILLLLLQKFAYKPILAMLSARKKEIQKTHEQAMEVEKQLALAKSKSEELLIKARKETEVLITETTKEARVLSEKILADAKITAEKTAAEARTNLERERMRVVQDIKTQLGETIALAIEKTVGDVLDEKASKKLLDEAVKKVTI